MTGSRRELKLLLGGFARKNDRFQDRSQCGFSDDLVQRAPFGDGQTCLKGPGKGVVVEDHIEPLIDRQNAFGHTGQNRLAPGSLKAGVLKRRVHLGGHPAEGLCQAGELRWKTGGQCGALGW